MKHLLLTGLNKFNIIFEKSEGFSIWQPKATLSVITTFSYKLLDAPASLSISGVQKTVKLLFRFGNTSPERFTAHWDYQSVALIKCPATKLLFATNNTLRVRWTILCRDKLGPRPTKLPAKSAKEGSTSGIVNTKNQKAATQMGISNRMKVGTPTSALDLRTTALGNFQFSPDVTIKNPLSSIDVITSKAPRDFNTFITVKHATLDEGGDTDEKFVTKQFHGICENLWTADPTMVLYSYPGKLQHSSHIMPYERRHTRFPQLKKFRKQLLYQNLEGIRIDVMSIMASPRISISIQS